MMDILTLVVIMGYGYICMKITDDDLVQVIIGALLAWALISGVFYYE